MVFIGVSAGGISSIRVANSLTPNCAIATIMQIHNTKTTELTPGCGIQNMETKIFTFDLDINIHIHTDNIFYQIICCEII